MNPLDAAMCIHASDNSDPVSINGGTMYIHKYINKDLPEGEDSQYPLEYQVSGGRSCHYFVLYCIY